MGGSFSNTQRFDRETHDSMVSEVGTVLSKYFLEYDIIPFYEEKKDFGDIDFVINSEKLAPICYAENLSMPKIISKVRLDLAKNFSNVESYSATGNAYVLVVDGVQVDINHVSTFNYRLFIEFFAYNGLNILINKLLQKNHCRISINNGFEVKVNPFFEYEYHRTHYYLISTEYFYKHCYRNKPMTMEFVCDFLELDYQKFQNGFLNYTEMFEWLMKSPYFTVDILNSSNLNAKKRREFTENKIIAHALKYFDNYEDGDVSAHTLESLSDFLDKQLQSSKVSSYKEEILELGHNEMVKEIATAHYRKAKEYMIEGIIKEFFGETITKKAFNYEYIRPLYMSGVLNSGSSLETVSHEVVNYILKKGTD